MLNAPTHNLIFIFARFISAFLVLTGVLACGSPPATPPVIRILGIISSRSAAEAVEGAHRFLDVYPGHEIVLRTPEQLQDLQDVEVQSLWANAQGVLLLGIFGDPVARLERLLAERPPPEGSTLLALSGDPRLARVAKIEGKRVFAGLSDAAAKRLTEDLSASVSPDRDRAALAVEFPEQRGWLEASAYRDARGGENLAGLFAWTASRHGEGFSVPRPHAGEAARFVVNGEVQRSVPLSLDSGRPVVVVVDYDSGDRAGDRALHRALCEAVEGRGLACVGLLARWGSASAEGLAKIAERLGSAKLSSIVVLQDFVIGGGEGRERATEALRHHDVPVIKALNMPDRTRVTWELSSDGVAWDKVHNRIAMPEIQGQSQPHVVAVGGEPQLDARTGIMLSGVEVVGEEVERLARRLERWRVLQTKANADKRVAIVYYNHPPGRHNIGADNLDVPATLMSLLKQLKGAGYSVGELPASSEALLERLQERGINLPNDAQALAQMHESGFVLPGEAYARWFETLSPGARSEMVEGPLARLRASVARAMEGGANGFAEERVEATFGDLHHLLESVGHRFGPRALGLLEQLEVAYDGLIRGDTGSEAWDRIDALSAAVKRTGVEGVRGWGPPPGKVMTWKNDVLIPGIETGNVLMGPQPPRGWEVDEELLHANLSFPPPHQYLAWYHWVRDVWKADVVIHVGRHSTAEFLPGKRNGLASDDYSQIVLGDLPNAYLYIVDGVGEGIQAKRRGQAVIIDHLTPALSVTPLYDQLLELRQLVESFEKAEEGHDDGGQRRAIVKIRAQIAQLRLEEELLEGMRSDGHGAVDSFSEVHDELVVHEVGHYLTKLQEAFMPLGLHVFGRPWSAEQVATMLRSMYGEETPSAAAIERLRSSPAHEGAGLLAALDGRWVAPGKGNDPIRTPDVLPTGRNFHALGGEEIPTRLAWDLGRTLAERAIAGGGDPDAAEAVILWASDTVRDEGAMVAFALALMGISPEWNSRGIVRGLHREPGPLPHGGRRDVTLVTSGLFRDLFPEQLVWLDRAVLLALDASTVSIVREHPELEEALEAALARLDPQWRASGEEPIAGNQVARHWVRDVQARLAQESALEAGFGASLRIFGNAPGGYGAGLNRLAERSGAWDTRVELADAWMHRMGHAYGVGIDGRPAHDGFRRRLEITEHTYLGRASNLYGLLDNNDAFDYLGGLSMAVEHTRGKRPENRIISHADPKDPRMAPLQLELMAELRGRELNPVWIAALMKHGYAGARTMGSEFFENLWGWQISNPEIVESWIWDEVKRVYIDDGYALGLGEFLDEGSRVHVKSNMLAILLVAAQKGFYRPTDAVLRELAQAFAVRVVAHGLPGSGHTRPDHAVMAFVRAELKESLRGRYDATLQAALGPPKEEAIEPARMAEEATPPPSLRSDLEKATSLPPLRPREMIRWWSR